jgi:hypothetical protein
VKLFDRLFLYMAKNRNVVPINREQYIGALNNLDAAATALAASGSLNDGTTPNALKRHITRKLTYHTASAWQRLGLGLWTGTAK